jgi:uncharacterized coiled-coil protein SlyX
MSDERDFEIENTPSEQEVLVQEIGGKIVERRALIQRNQEKRAELGDFKNLTDPFPKEALDRVDAITLRILDHYQGLIDSENPSTYLLKRINEKLVASSAPYIPDIKDTSVAGPEDDIKSLQDVPSLREEIKDIVREIQNRSHRIESIQGVSIQTVVDSLETHVVNYQGDYEAFHAAIKTMGEDIDPGKVLAGTMLLIKDIKDLIEQNTHPDNDLAMNIVLTFTYAIQIMQMEMEDYKRDNES